MVWGPLASVGHAASGAYGAVGKGALAAGDAIGGAASGAANGAAHGLGWVAGKAAPLVGGAADSGGYFLHSWGSALGKVYGAVDPRLGAAVGGTVSGGGTALQGGGWLASHGLNGVQTVAGLGWKGLVGLAGVAVLAAGLIGGLIARVASTPQRMVTRTARRGVGLLGLRGGGRHRAGGRPVNVDASSTTHVTVNNRKGLGVVGVVLIVLVTMVATGQTTWTQLAQGAPQALGNILPSACTATQPVPMPVPTGLVATGDRIGSGIAKASHWDASREHIDGLVAAGGKLAASAWQAMLDAIRRGETGTPASDPRTQVDYPTPSSSGDVVAASAALAAGFPDPVRAVAVAGAESGWRSVASPPNTNGTVDYGFWQVNSVHADLLARYDWHDPRQNALAALAVFTDRAASGRDGWSAWTTYTSGSSDAFMAQATQAVAVARGQLGPYPTLAEPASDPRVQPCAPTTVPVSAPAGSVAAKVLQYALAQVGKPYLWGAAPMASPAGPVPGSFDCSSLVDSAFLAAGVDLPGRQTTGTLVRLGTPIADGLLQPGDVVLPTSGHVGIYLGGGKYVDAPHTGALVRVEALPLPLYAARRIAGQSYGLAA